ncbi:MFS transporter [Microbulbifer mangrovi]|uniref:MFS transporter n=1 Tax=Microbulbifer mangrovi TaxID=927787 RepID=UPI0009908C8A|nr:MFS transporter [Microbulbifer mangrovi]
MRFFGPVSIIAAAQLFGTSLWFSANSAVDDLASTWQISATDIGWLTNAVQCGFILGTLTIALGGIADRYRASNIFILSACAGALFNACFAWVADGLCSALFYRFLVGLSLAGIYPMGMKLVMSWAPDRAGAALAQLVAMLTLGTALPHGLRELGGELPWQTIISASSLLALVAALLIYQLGDGPYLQQLMKNNSTKFKLTRLARPAVFEAFRAPKFRAAAWGYFGHMWELYAFWAVVPLLISNTALPQKYPQLGISGLSFCIIAVGALGCLLGGFLSRTIGSGRVAVAALASSGCCALIFFLFWDTLPPIWLFILLMLWGATVIADSPQFSAMSAKACPPELIGAALSIQNSLGFAITIISIAGISALFELTGPESVWILLPGPLLGLLGYWLTLRHRTTGIEKKT